MLPGRGVLDIFAHIQYTVQRKYALRHNARRMRTENGARWMMAKVPQITRSVRSLTREVIVRSR